MGLKTKFGEFKNFMVSEENSNVEEKEVKEEQDEMANSHIYLVEPEDFSKTEEMADLIKSGNSIVLNLNLLNAQSAQRMIDYLAGVVDALDGSLNSIGSRVVLIAPKCTKVHGKITKNAD